jgi:hypothetical protein
MTIPEALSAVRYVTDADGEKTDVLVPLSTWEALLASWTRVMELIEDQEDRAVLHEWLQQRATGKADAMPLDDLERELTADGLLPG